MKTNKNVTLREAVAEKRGHTAIREAYLERRAMKAVERIMNATTTEEADKAVNNYHVSKSYMKKHWKAAHGDKDDIELLRSDIEHTLAMRIYFARIERGI